MPHNNLGTVLLRRGRTAEAITQFQEALQLKPDFEVACYNLGTALAERCQLDEAIVQFQKAVELDPRYASAHNNLANALVLKGQAREALLHYETEWRLPPKSLDTAYNLAWLLATCPEASVRNGPEAIEVAQEGERLSGGQDPVFIGALAAAYAEAGCFPPAVATARRALTLAREQHKNMLVDALASQLTLYETGSPYRDLSPKRTPPPSD